MPKRAAVCLAPDGLEPVAEVKAAVADAAKRLERAVRGGPDGARAQAHDAGDLGVGQVEVEAQHEGLALAAR